VRDNDQSLARLFCGSTAEHDKQEE